MPGQDINKEREETPAPDSTPDLTNPACMTLEGIIDFTGELEHLNELIVLHLEKSGGFTGPESYFSKVQPILDLLEFELRVRCNSGMTQRQVKLIIQDWIDEEIANLRRGTRI
jgi:hypothetical protein